MQNVCRISSDGVVRHRQHVNDVIRKKTDADVYCVLQFVGLGVHQHEYQRVQQMIYVFTDRRRFVL